jgi:phosphoenolpyruvate carboxykinase (GTP)
VKTKTAGDSTDSPLGIMPTPAALGARDLGLSQGQVATLLEVDRDAWLREVNDQQQFLDRFGDRLPLEIRRELGALGRRLRTT